MRHFNYRDQQLGPKGRWIRPENVQTLLVLYPKWMMPDREDLKLSMMFGRSTYEARTQIDGVGHLRSI
ncbi:hypothetical protein CLV97_10927 [Planifilum fimeticola]|uniref:Uncharacterized protein n=1 Tax=Planifilum fimeticola TaxID=201975 RepID=A0A2T0LFV6_9BACL|nr:hypothetical protein [Planifilum fimeticola]PRX40976.1 hypothetical protein CLV97_10927 [Planifilum fimeticola]